MKYFKIIELMYNSDQMQAYHANIKRQHSWVAINWRNKVLWEQPPSTWWELDYLDTTVQYQQIQELIESGK